jgi:zinc protease
VSASRPFPFPTLAEETLPNGAAVVAARRPGVPLAAVRLQITAGAALDPARGEGLAHLTAIAARRGTRRRAGREIDQAAESLGAEMGSACDEDASHFGLSAATEHLPRLLDLVIEVATDPSFPAGEVTRLRRRELAGLESVIDEPGAVADRMLLRAVHPGHPYGHPSDGRVADVRRLARPQVTAFHRRWYAPALTTLVVVGDVDPGAVHQLARRRLGRWSAAGETPPEVPPVPPVPRGVLVVDKPDLSQTQIRIGCPAMGRRDPEYFAAAVANAALGGGFTSRLVEAIRVNRGLSYGVRSRFAMSRTAGMFAISSFTKNESAAELVEVALAEAARFAEEGPTADELGRAASWLAGLHPLSLETHEQVAEKIADLRLYGLGVDDVTGYADRVRAVDAEACRAVARRWFPLQGGVIVAVGPARKVAKALERFGPVTVVPARRTL